jgi:hypothetical protein
LAWVTGEYDEAVPSVFQSVEAETEAAKAKVVSHMA